MSDDADRVVSELDSLYMRVAGIESTVEAIGVMLSKWTRAALIVQRQGNLKAHPVLARELEAAWKRLEIRE